MIKYKLVTYVKLEGLTTFTLYWPSQVFWTVFNIFQLFLECESVKGETLGVVFLLKFSWSYAMPANDYVSYEFCIKSLSLFKCLVCSIVNKYRTQTDKRTTFDRNLFHCEGKYFHRCIIQIRNLYPSPDTVCLFGIENINTIISHQKSISWKRASIVC